jgi:hypothetical protein
VRSGCVLVGLIGLVSADARAQECRLHVDAGGLSARMVALLQAEMPDCEVVTSSGSATLSLAVMRTDGHLDVDMIAPPATSVLTRRVAIDEGDPEPALRRIALLAARAVESSASLPPLEVEPERSVHLSIGGSFVTHWWASPGRATFAPALALTIDLGAFDVGVWAALFVPNDRDVAGVEAEATELGVLLRGGWSPLAVGPISFGLELGGGVNAIWVRAKPALNVAPGRTDETRATTVEGLVRGGVAIEAWFLDDRLHAFARGGGLLRIPHVEVSIPEEYGAEQIRTGVLGPWVEVGLAARFF